MQVRNIKIFLSLLFILLISCSNKKIDQEILVKVFVENLIIDETYYADSILVKQKKLDVFKKYNITKEIYEYNLKLLSYDKEKWSEFFRKCNQLILDLRESKAIN